MIRHFRLALAAALVAVAAAALAAEPGSQASAVRKIYIMHFSHTDIGFTDMPGVCRELQQRYLDIAIDAVLASMAGPPEKKFYWTCESVLTVADWWRSATPARREEFLAAVRSGQLEVTALACNQTPFLNAAQWYTMLHWVPEDLWKQVEPRVALQNDVNGFPRAGALALLDRGITRLCMGINADSGGPPVARPSAFWWKMPDGRRLFVWLNLSYPDGYDFFEPVHWRRGPVPSASDTRYRPPREGEFFRTDEASLRAAHAQCLGRLDALRQAGYSHDVLAISMTNHWRIDNDPPFLPLAGFVAAWNRLGLKPELVLAPAAETMEALEQAVGPQSPEYQGEFTDWWANGTGSAPREVAASRLAKRLLAAAESPVWGPMPPSGTVTAQALYRDLCLFDEHTWGSSWSVAMPDALDTQAQFAEKAMLAWRPMGRAEWLLAQRVRSRLLSEGEGLYVAQTARQPFRGWVRMPATCLRDNYRSLRDPATGRRRPLHFENGWRHFSPPQSPEELTRANTAATFPDNAPNQVARFWVDDLPAESFVRLMLDTEPADNEPSQAAGLSVTVDDAGWPTRAQWEGMPGPLFEAGLADFSAVQVRAFAPRWKLKEICNAGSSPEGDRLRAEWIATVPAAADGEATVEETPFTRVYSQWLRHPRLAWAQRRVELWKGQPRARVTLRLSRIASEAPEIFYCAFSLPCRGTLPQMSSGGVAFTPFADQIPGSCRDYFGIDGWADYAAPGGHWLWVTRDAPLVTLDSPQIWTRRQEPPEHPERVLAMLFNNFWYTNFVADEHGAMEFQFELAWREKLDGPTAASELADALVAEPVVLINAPGADDPIVVRRLFAP